MRSRKSSSPVPPARTESVLVQHVGDEIVVYDQDSKEAHCLKALAAVVFQNADGQRSLADMAELARERLGRDVSPEDIADAVTQLETASLLNTPLVVLDQGISRRQAVRRFAYTGAAAMTATTLITSIAAPTALAACTGQPSGCACTKNKQCASNHCCGDQGNNGKCNAGCCADNNGNLCQCQIISGKNQCATPPTPTGPCCAGTCTPVNQPC